MNYTWNTPFLIPLSRQALANSNFIRIGVYALAGNRVILDPLRIAEYKELTGLQQKLAWRQHKLSYSITIIAFCLAAISLMLWVSSRRQPQYLYGCLSAIALAFSNFNFFVLHPVFGQNLWQALAHSSLDWFCVFAVQWIAAVQQKQNQFTRHLWVWGLLSSAVNLFLPVNYVVPTVELLHLVSIGIFLTALLQAYDTKGVDLFENRLLLAISTTCILMSLFDLLVQFGIVKVPGVPRLVPIVIFVTLLFYHIVLLRRFLQTYKAAHRSNAALAELVEEKEIQLNEQYQQLARLQAENARANERQHIFREIHDGLGGHLVSAMALSKRVAPNEAVLSALRSAHDDMRLLIDGGSIEEADLGALLGLLRPRLQPQLDAAGIQLHWKVDPAADLPVLDVEQRMHFVRIIQECITNVIKHADATTVTLSCVSTNGNIKIAVADNGAGKGIQNHHPGNGLSNMHYRAAQLGGAFSFHQNDSGSTAALTLGELSDLQDGPPTESSATAR